MKSAPYCLLLLVWGLTAQTPLNDLAVTRLNSTLMAVKGATSLSPIRQQLVSDIMALAEKGHQPSRPTVTKFVDALTVGLPSDNLSINHLSIVTTSIIEVLHSAGTGTLKFRASVNGAQQALISLGVGASNATSIAANLTELGNEVRGPDDLRVLPVLQMRQILRRQ